MNNTVKLLIICLSAVLGFFLFYPVLMYLLVMLCRLVIFPWFDFWMELAQ